MSDEENAPAPPETPPAGTPVAPIALADEKGVLREGWLESLPEELRTESFLGEVKDIQGMAKSAVNARRMVGKDKIAIPNESSSQEEIEAFHRAGGRPDTAADYNFVKPEDFPQEHWSEDFATKAQEILFKRGASKEMASELLALNVETILAGVKAQAETDERDFKDAETAMRTEFGNAYDQKIHLGNVAIEKGSNEDAEFKERVVKKFGNDPDFIKFTCNLGGLFSEHSIPIPGIPTPGELGSKINEEMAKDSYTNAKNPDHKNQVALVARLFREKVAAAGNA